MTPVQRLTVKEAALAARRHPKTIQKALESGELHGSQRAPRHKWLIQTACLDAWIEGALCEHMDNLIRLSQRSA